MNLKTAIFCGAVVISGLQVVNSMPASRDWLRLVQPDGSVATLRQCGDENFHYFVDANGATLVEAEDGYYRQVDRESVKSLQKQQAAKKNQYYRNRSKSISLGEKRFLVILVEYADVEFTVGNQSLFNDMMNKEGYDYGGATGSCRDYYDDNSMGQFKPQFDVVGPVKLSQNRAYYGANNSRGEDIGAAQMVMEACKAVDAQVNFADYDADGDGYVDNVYVFYAGYGEHDTGISDAIWPHSFDLINSGSGTVVLDGVSVNHYATSNELQGSGVFTGIGVFCHEFNHVLGLPDLYSTTYSDSFTPGSWSIMDMGGYCNQGFTPPYMTAYERYDMGWLEPIELDKPATINLRDISENEAYRVTTESANEYFLFENRQQEGWDTYIPGHGMLVWHIDFNQTVWDYNIVNNYDYHQYVDIEEADNVMTDASRAGDAFPGTANVTSFTDSTTPSMLSWAGEAQNKPITEITESGGVVTFKVMGGQRNISVPQPKEATGVTPVSFVANWIPCEDCDYQRISVYSLTSDDEKIYVDGFDGLRLDATSEKIEVAGLKPSTVYYYSLCAGTQYEQTDYSEPMEVTTAPPTYDMKPVVATDASAVGSDSFTANWEALDGTEAYFLTVKRRIVDETIYSEICDFADKKFPDGWSGEISAPFSASGYYGEAAPSMSLSENGQFIASKQLDGNVVSFSFWIRTMSYSEQGRVVVFGFDGNGWKEIARLPLAASSEPGEVKSWSCPDGNLPEGLKAMKIELMGDIPGRVVVDDMRVDYKASIVYEPVDAYTELNVENTIEKVVTGLVSGASYEYVVRGWNGSVWSLESEAVVVDLAHGGADAVAANRANIWIQEGKLHVGVSAIDSVVNVYAISGILVASGTASAGSNFVANLPMPGIYIVKVGNQCSKVINSAK